MVKVVHDVEASNEPAGGSLLDEIVRDGARQMLAAALQAEIAAYVEQFKDEFDEHGRRLVVRNGFHAEREVTTAAGAIPVRAPRVNDKRVDEATGERKRFGSAILPAWARKSPRVAEVLPLLYLHGLSSSDFAPALTQFLGTSHGLSAATITRLTKDWQDEATAFNKRSLADTDYVYLWVDGIHLEVRLEQDKVCLLVMIGVRADGTKELVALTDGHRESSPPPASNAAGSTRSPTSSTRSPSPHSPARGPRWPRSGTPKTASTPRPLPAPSWPSTAPSGPKRSRSSPTTSTCCWSATTTRRALGPPACHEPDRVDLRHRPPSAAGHQGARIAGGRRGDGVQAHRVRPATVACRQRTPPRRSRPGRSPVREGPPGRTSRRIRRRSASRMTRQSAGLDSCSCAREGAPDEC
jgi:hypothetical protein